MRRGRKKTASQKAVKEVMGADWDEGAALDQSLGLPGEEVGNLGWSRTDRATALENDVLGVEYAESAGCFRESGRAK